MAPQPIVLPPDQVAAYAYNAGFRGNDLITAVAIAMRESSGNVFALNPVDLFDKPTDVASSGDQSWGLWQINTAPKANPTIVKDIGYTGANSLLTDPYINAQAAYKLYTSNGDTFNAWGAYKGASNTANTDMATASAAVQTAQAKGYFDANYQAGLAPNATLDPGKANPELGSGSPSPIPNNIFGSVTDFLNTIWSALTSRANWLRVGLVLGAVILTIFGLSVISKSFGGPGATDIAKVAAL
jgi:Lysozyme like domain